jgi:hypothetical protein
MQQSGVFGHSDDSVFVRVDGVTQGEVLRPPKCDMATSVQCGTRVTIL